MKTHLQFFLFILIFLFMAKDSFAQWERLGGGEDFANAALLNSGKGYVSAYRGGFVFTTNDGFRTYQKVPTGISESIIQFEIVNKETAYALSNFHKYVIKTVNGGESWVIVLSDTSINNKFQDIEFINADTGWVAYGKNILFTSDGGINWDVRSISFITHNIEFFDLLNGYALASNHPGLFTTTNGGIHWNYQDIRATDMIFKDSLSGLLYVPPSEILITSDRGQHWLTQNSPIGSSHPVLFEDSIIIMYKSNYIARSKDLGATWEITDIEFNNTLHYAFSKDSIYRFGPGGKIQVFLDSLNLWQNLSTVHGGEKILFFDELNGMTAPWFITTDGGENWIQKDINLPVEEITDFHFFTPRHGMVCKLNSIYTTEDGGITWQEMVFDQYFKKLFFIDSLYGWALLITETHMQGTIRTTDGGKSWSTFESMDYTDEERLFHFFTRNLGFIYDDGLSYDYKGFRTTDGGITWHLNEFAESIGISFTDSNNGYGIWNQLDQNYLIKTSDAGASFTFVVEGYFGDNIYFIDSHTGWVSAHLNIDITTDGGENWSREYISNTTFSEIKSWAVHGNYLYAAGEYGTLLRRSLITTGVTTKDHLPGDFTLHQNSPNPFNPVTTIRYDVPVRSLITLKVYDVLGNEIADLVHEEKSPGNYNVEFNATNISSGIYFYRLQAGKFEETRKMILVK